MNTYYTCEQCTPLFHAKLLKAGENQCGCFHKDYPHVQWVWDTINTNWVVSQRVEKDDLVRRAYRHGLWSQFTSVYFKPDQPHLLTVANMEEWYDRWINYKEPPVPLQLATRTHFRINDGPFLLPEGWSSNHNNPRNPKDNFELRRTMWESEQQEPSDPMPFVLGIIALILFVGWCCGMLCHWMIVR